MSAVSVHWFRHGLRLHDNPALVAALKDAQALYPVFIFDGEVAGTINSGFIRMRFLMESLEDLDRQLRELGSRLYSFQGKPHEVFRQMFREWEVTRLTFIQDPEPVYIERDDAVKQLCAEMDVTCEEHIAHTLWDPERVVNTNNGRPPHTFKLFRSVTCVLGDPSEPCDDPDFSHIKFNVPCELEDRFALPTLKELDVEPEFEEQVEPFNRWKGGETEALRLFTIRMESEEKAYGESILLPNHFNINLVNTPKSLSPYLRFGCLSVRKFYWALNNTYEKVCQKAPPPSLFAQLLWREYFICMSYNNLNFDRMEGNPICLNIPWYKDADRLKTWELGQTGFPWIDACMNQLRHEGWCHHVCRHAVSCFLTRGDLWLSWEEGAQVFYKYLLDGDWSICAGNWMWVSSSAFENCLSCPQCFSPIYYGMQMDPKGEYVRRYVPALKSMPLKYLFSPWKAPADVQKEAGCVIGEDYPHPMVDHIQAWRKCKNLMEETKAIFKNPDMWHCTPSDSTEALSFSCLPRKKCRGDEDCDNLCC